MFSLATMKKTSSNKPQNEFLKIKVYNKVEEVEIHYIYNASNYLAKGYVNVYYKKQLFLILKKCSSIKDALEIRELIRAKLEAEIKTSIKQFKKDFMYCTADSDSCFKIIKRDDEKVLIKEVDLETNKTKNLHHLRINVKNKSEYFSIYNAKQNKYLNVYAFSEV